ncbi:hypothetical protein GCK72_003778 [Caenorhabditis remanei]|uniref:F-box associated domain-containing protein n=1 Tax=Caenorhabditis remanei TaxID=31234 RepID=A0A6A5HBQ7_CAERE|nr:hypothetical protein GCK72_003778 [Caenorhabditis remanei]KAF1763832.1 hypothetical protein GCK72_003778 [Caenorhabditis remanei]
MLSTLALKYCHQILFDLEFLIRKEFKFKKLPTIVRMLIIQLMDPAERLHYNKATLIENTALAINKMSGVFNMDGLEMVFTKVTPSLIRLKNIFSNDTFESSWLKITLHEIVLNSEIVNIFLNMADRRKEFYIFDCDMPLDFKHENAFKFGTICYFDARWVTLSDMLNIRAVENVTLGETTLTSIEVRYFISRWINCPRDMFKSMTITAMEIIQLGGLFNKLVVLEHDMNPPNIGYFTLAKSTSRAHKLLFIDYTLNAVVLSAWKPYDNADRYGNIKEKFKNVYEIMELLEKEKTLENELEESRDVTKQREYRDQIQELERKIHELGVVYRDGRATI